jgi:hypothetical protein
VPRHQLLALRGRWLVIVRAAWIIIATLALGLFVASIPAYVLTLGKTLGSGLRLRPLLEWCSCSICSVRWRPLRLPWCA